MFGIFWEFKHIFEFEVDWLCAARSDEISHRIKWEFLEQMDEVQNDNDAGVIVIGTTSIPWVLDKAFLRWNNMHEFKYMQ